jgi:hypothetical protein
VLDRRVEVDVVADLDRQAQVRIGQREPRSAVEPSTIAARVASHVARPSARNGFSAGAANVPSGTGSRIARRSIASSCSRTTHRGAPPRGAATPYGRLSGPNTRAA